MGDNNAGGAPPPEAVEHEKAKRVADSVMAASCLLELAIGDGNVYLVVVRPVEAPEQLAFGTNVEAKDAARVLAEARQIFENESKRTPIWRPGEGLKA